MADGESFQAVLDETCDRLWDTKVQYSLRRIAELDAALQKMETELDGFVSLAQ
ncbi:hypothetical protein AGMMS49928_07670 [Spirochaetia bacterium]|nr:hypothetical protein AGMMS49928_07670 [Spirochaetia bacterium]